MFAGKPVQREKPYPIGMKTPWGQIKSIHSGDWERQYMMIDKHGAVTLMPESVIAAHAMKPPAEMTDTEKNRCIAKWIGAALEYTHDLNAIRLVEARLTEEQWGRYVVALTIEAVADWGNIRIWKKVINASASEKATALVAVLQSEEK